MHRRRPVLLSLAVVSALAVSLLSVPAQAAEVPATPATLSGTVQGATDQPLPGVCVELRTGAGWDQATVVTGADGAWRATVAPGTYGVTFRDCTRTGLVTAFYDGATDSADATPLDVTAGEQVTGVDAVMVVGGTLSGRVTDPPGSDSRICVNADWERQSYDPLFPDYGSGTRVDADGTYTVTGLADRDYVLYFQDCSAGDLVATYYPGVRYFEEADRIEVRDAAAVTGLDVTMQIGGRISGRVTSAAGAPLERICVQASDDGDRYITGRQTEVDGTYTLSGLREGGALVSFNDCGGTGYLRQYADGRADAGTADVLEVVSGEQIVGVDAVMRVGGRISGRVLDSAGSAVEGACVSAEGDGNYSYVRTDSTGTYELVSLESDSYRVLVRDCYGEAVVGGAPTYAPSTTDRAAASVTVLTAPAVVAGVDVVVIAGGSITGSVQTPEGDALPGMCINTWNQTSGSGGSARSAADGTFTVPGLATGDYYGWVVDCAGGDRVNGSLYIAVTAGTAVDVGPLTMALGGSISGTVRDSRGAGIAGACVGGTGNGTRTDSRGAYVLRGIAGQSPVYVNDCAQGTDHLSAAYAVIDQPYVQVPVAPGERTTGIDVVLQDAGAISGRIANRPTNPICVGARSPNGDQSMTSSYSPGYRLGDLPGGDVAVSFGPCTGSWDTVYRWNQDQPSYESADLVTVVPGQVTPGIDVDFSRSLSGEPVRSALLTATPSSGEAPLTTRLVGSVVGGGNGPFDWVLDAGDGTPVQTGQLATSTDTLDVEHVYTRRGVVEPRLRITTTSGTVLETTTEVAVDVRPASAPRTPTVVEGDGQLTLSWTPPTDLGEPALSSYVVEAEPSGARTTVDGVTRTATLVVPNGVQQSLTVRADGDAGPGASSEAVVGTARATTSTTLEVEPLSGDPLTLTTLTATVSGSAGDRGDVRFTDGSYLIGSAQLQEDGTASLTVTLPPGSHALVADYSGSGSDRPSTSTSVDVVRDPYTTSTSYFGGDRSVPLDDQGSVAVTVEVPGAKASLPTGLVELVEDGNVVGQAALVDGSAEVPLSGLAVGPHSLQVRYAGDDTHYTSSAGPLVVTVLRPTTTALDIDPDPSAYGQSVRLTATVTTDGASTPSGDVAFTDGVTVLAVVPVDDDGTAITSTSGLPVGTRAITAAYAGDDVHEPSTSGALQHVVVKASSSVTLTVLPETPTTLDEVTLTAAVAVVAPGAADVTGTVTFTDGETTLGTAALDVDGRAVLRTGRLSGGTHELAATYAGDAQVDGSSGALSTDVVVERGAVEVTVQSSAGQPLTGATVMVVLPDGISVRGTTGGSGTALLSGLPDGTFTVVAARSGYLPGKGQVVVAGGEAAATVVLKEGPIATATLTSEPMTPEEMLAVGIDPNDPENTRTIEFSINLAFVSSGSGGGGGFGFSGYVGRSSFVQCPTVEGVVVTCTGAGTASWSSGGYDWSASAGGDGRIVFLVIPATASWLKEFFAVEMLVANLAEPDFPITSGSAALELPAGLVLAPTAQPQSLLQSVEGIPGGEARGATWFVRGDDEGSYDLQASYEGTLQPFGDPVVVTARTAKPLRVWGASALKIVVEADDAAVRYEPYRVRVSLQNVADVPVYNLSLELLEAADTGYLYQPEEQRTALTAELAPGQSLSRDVILLPQFTGTLLLDRSFVAASAGADQLESEIISRPRTAPQEPGLRAVAAEDKIGFEWPAVPGATEYRVFSTAADDVPFSQPPLALTMLSEPGDSLQKGWIPAVDDEEGFYAISPLVDGVPAMEQPMVEAKTFESARTLTMSLAYDIPSQSFYTCDRSRVPVLLTTSDSFFGLSSYSVQPGVPRLRLTEPLSGFSAEVPYDAQLVSERETFTFRVTNTVGDETERTITFDQRCLQENAVVLAMGLNSSLTDQSPSETRSHTSAPECVTSDGQATSGIDAFSDQAATSWCSDADNERGNLVGHLVARGYDPGETRYSAGRTLLEFSYNGADVSCDPTPTLTPRPYSKAATGGEILTELSLSDITTAQSYFDALIEYQACWRIRYGRELRFSVVGHSLGGYQALALARAAAVSGVEGVIEDVVSVDGAVNNNGGIILTPMLLACGMTDGAGRVSDEVVSSVLSNRVQGAYWLATRATQGVFGSVVRGVQDFGIRVATVTNHKDTCLREDVTINDAADETAVWSIGAPGWTGIQAHSAPLHSGKSPVDQPGYPLAAFLDKGWVDRHRVVPPASSLSLASSSQRLLTSAKTSRLLAVEVTPALRGRLVAAPGGLVTGGQIVAVSGSDQHTADVAPDGSFELAIPAGDYRVFVQPFGSRAAGFWIGGATRTGASTVTVDESGAELDDVIVAAPVTTTVRVQLADGTAIDGAGVLLTDADGQVAGGFTAADGTTELVAPPGEYTLSAVGLRTTAVSREVDARAASTQTIVVQPAAGVEVRMVDADGQPLAGVIAAVYDDDVLVGTGITDENGTALVLGLPAGDYTVRFYEELERFASPERAYAFEAVVGRTTTLSVASTGVVVADPVVQPVPGSGTDGGSGGGGPVTPGPIVTPSPSPSPSPSPAPVPSTRAGTYEPVVPARVFDSRVTGPAIAVGRDRAVAVLGAAGVPDEGVTAVVLNVTSVGTTAATDVQVYPTGARPERRTSNLNPVPGAAVASLVTTAVGADGTVSLSTAVGSTHLAVDVLGWYGDGSTEAAGGTFRPLTPHRILDTRLVQRPVTAGSDRAVTVTGTGGVPEEGVDAVVVNLTSVGSTAPTDVQLYPWGDKPSLRTSNLNLGSGEARANLVVVKVGEDGRIGAATAAGATHVVLDVVGWYGASSTGDPGLRFVAAPPARVYDTRVVGEPLLGQQDRVVRIAGSRGVPADAAAVVASLTVVAASAPADLQAFATGRRPARRTSNVNVADAQAVPNAAVIGLGAGGDASLSLSNGSAHAVIDVAGWFVE